MRENWKITYFKPDVQGVFPTGNSVRFAACLPACRECGVVIYDGSGAPQKIPFSNEGRRGALYGIQIEGEGIDKCTYNFFEGSRVITDPYARGIRGLEKWGSGKTKKRRTYGVLSGQEFDWQGDAPLMTPLEDSIFYGLNVRGFTMHKSSGVKCRGTFEGIVEKIPYLKGLGVSAVELMPCYEYDECMVEEKNLFDAISFGNSHPSPSVMAGGGDAPGGPSPKVRVNCWGFQNGFYFAPKAAYSGTGFPALSFKNMVRELHKNGIEVIMQFFFPWEVRQLYMLDVIKYWVMEYHIDGARISGQHIPFRLLAEEPLLKNTKIWCSYLPGEDMSVIANPDFKNFISDNGNYRNDMRRFLKGDEGLMNQMVQYQRRNPGEYGVANYLADYDGFSLYDCVAYERKHNEANGEDNRDGGDLNFTWNCGVEGETRKKAVLELRQKQIKNALSLVFLSQGIPFIFSGDEFGDTRAGNNNCYCQDNEIGWVVWRNNSLSRDILSYVKFLIRLRRENPVLHMKDELKVMDYKGCGYPDISYHGTEAWRPDLSYISRMIGIVLCGCYAPGGVGDSLYIAFNMHWEPHKLALPKLGKNEKWVKLADTSQPVGHQDGGDEDDLSESIIVTINSRSVAVFKARKYAGKGSGKKRPAGVKGK